MKLLWCFLAGAAAVGLGYHIGRGAQRQSAKRSADEAHRALADLGKFVESLAELRRLSDELRNASVAITGGKRGASKSMDEALADGDVAFYKPGDSGC